MILISNAILIQSEFLKIKFMFCFSLNDISFWTLWALNIIPKCLPAYYPKIEYHFFYTLKCMPTFTVVKVLISFRYHSLMLRTQVQVLVGFESVRTPIWWPGWMIQPLSQLHGREQHWLIDWQFYFSSITHFVQLLFSVAETYTHHSCII